MQDGLTLEDRETRSAGMLQPSIDISCDGLVALAHCSTGGSCSAVTDPEPAAPEALLDAATAAARSTTGAASAASPNSERLHSRVSVYERSSCKRSAGMPSNGSSSASCSSCCDASSFPTGDASCTTPPTSPPPLQAVAMFTIGEDAPSWGRDDPKEPAELQPSGKNACSSAACPATKIVASCAADPAQPDSSAALDRMFATAEAGAPHPDVLPPTSSSKHFAAAVAPGGVLSSLGTMSVACAHTNGSLLLPSLHSLQEVCFSRAVSSGEPSIASVEEGAECAGVRSVVTSTTGSATYSQGRLLKHRSKQRCSSASSNDSAEETGIEGAVACAARRQFEAMLPLRLAIGSTRQPIGSCDCSAARSAAAAAANADAVAAAESKQSHRLPLQSRKSCSAISSDDGESNHKMLAVGDRAQPPPQQHQPQSTVGGGAKAIGRISSAAELAGTTKRSWQRSVPMFGRSKSLVCTSGPAGGTQPLPASTAPPHALFLADASPRSKSYEAWRAQSGNGEKRNTFRKIARNVRNMMALLRIQKPHRSAAVAGSSSALSSPPPSAGCAQVTLEMAENWASSFNLLLANKEGVELFRSFLHSEYSEENIEFWMACEEYRSTKAAGAAKLQAKAQAIFTRFVAPHAPKEVNLDSKTRLETESNLEHPDCNAFESAKQRIQCLMEKDSYPRFLRSPVYMELMEQLRAAAGGSAL